MNSSHLTMNRAQFDGETLQCEQLILNQLYCDGRGSEDGGQAVESKRHGIGFRGIKGRLVNRCCPQGIVELNQSLERSGGGMSGSDFDPSGAIFCGV